MKTFRSRVAVPALLACLGTAPASLAQGLPSARPERMGMSSERLARIRPVMQAYVDAGKLPGVLTAVARRGRLVHSERVGMMDVEAGRGLRSDTLFRIYSMTKPVTGVAVLILYEEGRFLLTDPVSKYLPELDTMQVLAADDAGALRAEPARPMTIKHLLTHTSGLIYGDASPGLPRLYEEADLFSAPSLAEFVERVSKLPLASQPGTEWHYGVSTDVLGRLIEVVSGAPFDRFLEERIFVPLGMPDTAFSVPAEKLDRFAAAYTATPEAGLQRVGAEQDASFRNPRVVPYGGHGLVSTAADYLRFAQMLLAGGQLDRVRILAPGTVELMMSNHLEPELGPEPMAEAAGWYQYDPGGIGHGLAGGVVTDVARSSSLGSTGTFFWGGFASTLFWVDPREQLVGLLLTQLIPSTTYPIRGEMRALTYQALLD